MLYQRALQRFNILNNRTLVVPLVEELYVLIWQEKKEQDVLCLLVR